MKTWLYRIRTIIDKADGNDFLSKVYDLFMMISIIASIIPLCFIKQTHFLILLDKITICIFILDYLLRWITINYGQLRPIKKYILYPFSFMAIIDLISILPSLLPVNNAFKLFRILRLFKTFRIFKFFRYSRNIQIITNVIKREKEQLVTVGILSLGYIFISALIVFQVEPYTFGNLFKAVYWATVSLTTVGYGDIYPTSDIGRIVSMISSFIGIAIVALPAGIIVNGYSDELNDKNTSQDK